MVRWLNALVAIAAVRPGAALRQPRRAAAAARRPRSGGNPRVRAALRVSRGGFGGLEPIEVAGHVAVSFWSFGSTIAAGRAQMDAIGSLVTAFFGTLGGSTMRDLILGRRVFWVVDPSYLGTLGLTSLLTFALYPWIAHKANFEGMRRTRAQLLVLEVPDATGMAFYSVYGAWIALHGCAERSGTLVAILMGLCTSTFASIIADPLCGRRIRLLHSGESLYAAPALLAATIYALWDARAPQSATSHGTYVAFAVAVLLRVAGVTWDIKLPVWLANGAARTTRGFFAKKVETVYFEQPASAGDASDASGPRRQ